MSDAEFDLTREDEEMSAAEAALLEAQRRVAELRQRNRPKVLDEVRRKIEAYQFTAAELGFVPKAVPAAGKTTAPAERAPDVAKAADGRSVVKPKYIGPAGQPWSGRGKSPLWLTEALQAGRSLDDFRVTSETSN